MYGIEIAMRAIEYMHYAIAVFAVIPYQHANHISSLYSFRLPLDL